MAKDFDVGQFFKQGEGGDNQTRGLSKTTEFLIFYVQSRNLRWNRRIEFCLTAWDTGAAAFGPEWVCKGGSQDKNRAYTHLDDRRKDYGSDRRD